MQLNEFINLREDSLTLRELFNEEHAWQLLEELDPAGVRQVSFENVGVRIMRQTFRALENLRSATLAYDWQALMLSPRLVCYDKNRWSSPQQLLGWNREWGRLFEQAHALQQV